MGHVESVESHSSYAAAAAAATTVAEGAEYEGLLAAEEFTCRQCLRCRSAH